MLQHRIQISFGVRSSLLTSLLLFCSIFSSAGSDTLYTGVYELDGRAGFLIVLKNSGNGYVGFTGTVDEAVGIRGEVYGPMLQVRFMEGDDSTINYIIINEKNDLQLSDGLFTFFIFKRMAMDADSLYARLSEKNKKVEEAVTRPTNATASRYSGKKFLHLKSGNGYSEKWAYYLYADGTFRFKGDNSYVNANASENFSGATSSEDTGRWDVILEDDIEYLLLQWKNGQSNRLRIIRTAEGYDLNGKGYFLVGHSDYE